MVTGCIDRPPLTPSMVKLLRERAHRVLVETESVALAVLNLAQDGYPLATARVIVFWVVDNDFGGPIVN